MAQVEAHVNQYKVDIMKGQRAKSIRKDDLIEVELENGAVLKAKTAILTVGAHWRNVNVPGEEEFRTKGVTNCPHCDGPLFAGQDVAVIGGGNSGIEAAIDLAGLAKHLRPEGEGWLIISDIAERLGLRRRDELLAWISSAGLVVVGRSDTRPRHPKAKDRNDPLYQARSTEITSLWRLRAA